MSEEALGTTKSCQLAGMALKYWTDEASNLAVVSKMLGGLKSPNNWSNLLTVNMLNEVVAVNKVILPSEKREVKRLLDILKSITFVVIAMLKMADECFLPQSESRSFGLRKVRLHCGLKWK